MHLKGTRVGAYARYSSDKQSDSSIEDQLRRARTFASVHGRTVAEKLTFTDHAISGASTARPGFEALMEAVKRREIDVLLVEDTSRLSRDNADALNLYKTLAFYNVQLVSIADGIDSSAKGAKVQFSVKALMSDLYLEDLRDKTLRGMEGRAHAGLATGGRLLGYRSIPQLGPDGKPASYQLQIDPDAAAIVRRIFETFLSGHSITGIAKMLNRKGVPAPRDKTRHGQKSGWSTNTVGNILRNERYTGVWTFNERRWVKVPGTNKRRPEWKDPSEVIRNVREDLRIIEQATWEEVQIRLRKVKDIFTRNPDGSPKGRAHGAVSVHPFSGLLTCEACEGPMVIMGGNKVLKYYACKNNRRGRCDNALTVRTDVVRSRIFDRMRERLKSEEGIRFARKQIAADFAEMARTAAAEVKDHQARLQRIEGRIANLVEVLASGERSDAITKALRDMEVHAATERKAIEEAQQAASQPIRLPSPDEIMQMYAATEALLEEDPVAGREELRRYFDEEKIALAVGPDGFYIAKYTLLPGEPIRKALKTLKPAPGDDRGRALYVVSSGGATTADLTTVQIRSVA